MGKKSKAHRKKPPVATAAGATGTATATAAGAPATATETRRGDFPESTYLVKGESLWRKGKNAKAQKIYFQGIENGCVRCLSKYTMKIWFDGATKENRAVGEYWKDNKNLHLALPLLLEGAIRGSAEAIKDLVIVYGKAIQEEKIGHDAPAAPLYFYWRKHASKTYDQVDDRNRLKQENEDFKEGLGSQCSVCGKQDSETITLLKCDGCHFCFYCSKECQKKMWVEGQHAGVCRQLGILQQYHKPFARKIWKDIALHGIPPKNIPELQELRNRLGLSRPQAEYQELLDAAKAGRLDPVQLLLPRKDGTVQIRSFPRPI